jgi:uncharacterized protein
MRSIDCHVHLYPPELNARPAEWARARGEHHWEVLCARVRKSGRPVQGFPNVEELLRAMDAAEVERAILQGWYWEHHDTCVLQNRFFAECCRQHPDRLSACATFHPGAGEEALFAELRWAGDAGFCGLGELSPHSQQVSVNDPRWNAALEEAGRLSLPVLLHVTEPQGKQYPGRVLTPLPDFLTLAQRHPHTTFVLAHWGARLPLDPVVGPAIRQLTNVMYDTAASPLLYEPGVFRQMVDAAGADRILFGSDFPLVLYPRDEVAPGIARFAAELRSAGLSDAEVQAVRGANAARVFRLRSP